VVLEAISKAVAVIVYVTSSVLGTVQLQEEGANGLTQVSIPLIKKATFAMPTSSEAFALMVTVDPSRTFDPLAGWVMETLGGIVSGGDCLGYAL